MYVKTTTRKTERGSVRYVQLAHNEWDPVSGRSVPKILYRFGREDQLDRDAVGRLVASLSRLLDPGEALAAAPGMASGQELVFCESRPFGGTFTLDALWRRLGLDAVIRELGGRRRGGARRGRPREVEVTERVLFALVANRALAPGVEAGRRGLDHPRRPHRRAGRGRSQSCRPCCERCSRRRWR